MKREGSERSEGRTLKTPERISRETKSIRAKRLAFVVLVVGLLFSAVFFAAAMVVGGS